MDGAIRTLVLLAEGGEATIDRAWIDFPHVAIEVAPAREAGADALVDHATWISDALDAWALDRRIDVAAATDGALRLRGPAEELGRFAREVLIRAQRRAPRRNEESRGARFDRVLDAHRALHDRSRPLVRADHDHALDAWQWTLRLDRAAPAAVQLAALLHDVERLESEALVRIEQHAVDYRAFKEAHARAGARMAESFLLAVGLEAALASEVAALVAASETPDGARGVTLVNDADALSFFSLNSPGYLAYYGPEKTREKIAYTLARTSVRARAELSSIRLRPAVARLSTELARLAAPGDGHA